MAVISWQKATYPSLHLWWCIIIALLLYSCANESVPQGGKKDTTAAKAVKIDPPNKTLHFHSDHIEITFNEFIKPTGFLQTLISPPMDGKPTYKVHGRKLSIKLKGALRDSITYTINFADDIKDLNEGNITNNFTYVFSTGDYIDSQKVSGRVTLAKDNSPQDGVVVSLYPVDSVDGILRAKPFYFTKTNKDGQFQISNVRANYYRIYALKDQNYNYKYDQPNELIGFSDSLLNLSDTLPHKVDLHVFEANTRKIQFDGIANPIPGNLTIAYTGQVQKFELQSSLISNSDFFYYNETRDTITYWYSKYYRENAHVVLIANDTLIDSTKMELKFISADSMAKSHNPAYFLSIPSQYIKQKADTSAKAAMVNVAVANIQPFYQPVKVNFNWPVDSINDAKQLLIKEDTATVGKPFKFSLDKKTKQFITGDFDKKENTKYTIEIPDSTFRDIFGSWNKRLRYKFQTNEKDNFGNLHLTLHAADSTQHYIIKLLNENGEVLQQIPFSGSAEKKVDVNNLLAGSYKFAVIDDRNNNGKWDTGNFRKKIQPEKVYTIKDTYQLKGGWDLDVEVKF